MNPCGCGCGSLVRGQWKHGHNRRKPPTYAIDAETGCWVWQGSIGSNGYGRIRERRNGGTGRNVKAHRWMYEQLVGPIPAGLDLDHTCHNADASCAGGPTCPHRRCVNPAHLEPVTNAQNAQRGAMAKLTWDDVRAIRASSVGCTTLAREYGVHEDNILSIRHGRTWKEKAA